MEKFYGKKFAREVDVLNKLGTVTLNGTAYKAFQCGGVDFRKIVNGKVKTIDGISIWFPKNFKQAAETDEITNIMYKDKIEEFGRPRPQKRHYSWDRDARRLDEGKKSCRIVFVKLPNESDYSYAGTYELRDYDFSKNRPVMVWERCKDDVKLDTI